MSCGAETEANDLLVSLIGDEDFTLPPVNLDDPAYGLPDPTLVGGPVARLTNEDLTTRVVGGTGTFDALMASFGAHLKQQYDNGRITGAEYTKAYIALTEGAMGNATQFLLGKEQAYWQAVAAQQQAMIQQVALVTARVTMQTAKVQLAAIQLEALTTKAKYALTKLQLATESMAYCKAKFEVEELMPLQKQIATSQMEGEAATTALKEFDLNSTKPAELNLLVARKVNEEADISTKQYQLGHLLPAQVLMIDTENRNMQQRTQNLVHEAGALNYKNTVLDPQESAARTVKINIDNYNLNNLMVFQGSLLKEQVESVRAQTADNRLDGPVITGVLGRQKALYAQQIESYRLDSVLKGSRIFTDAWITMKTIDEGFPAPGQYNIPSLEAILQNVRNNFGI